MKNVQIPYDLFMALVEYHLAYDNDYAEEIRQELEQKLWSDTLKPHTQGDIIKHRKGAADGTKIHGRI